MPATRTRVQQYSGPKDLLERLARDLQRLQQANSPAAALDAAITYCCTAWSLTAWLFMSIAREPAVRRQIAQLADRGMATIDVEVFGAGTTRAKPPKAGEPYGRMAARDLGSPPRRREQYS